ncbi:hypothetical protein ACOME3_007944 [Neoechinorhynchus agilis]
MFSFGGQIIAGMEKLPTNKIAHSVKVEQIVEKNEDTAIPVPMAPVIPLADDTKNIQCQNRDVEHKKTKKMGRPIINVESNAAKHAVDIMESLIRSVELEVEGRCSERRTRGRPKLGCPSYAALIKMAPEQVKSAFEVDKKSVRKRTNTNKSKSTIKRPKKEDTKTMDDSELVNTNFNPASAPHINSRVVNDRSSRIIRDFIEFAIHTTYWTNESLRFLLPAGELKSNLPANSQP